jgi:hypothetical protein
MYIDDVTSEWRTNFPTIRYRNDITEFEKLSPDLKESVFWMSAADSVLMPIFYSDYEKTFLMYVGVYNGLGYFDTDRLYDDAYFN